jgi:hypothetical protein
VYPEEKICLFADSALAYTAKNTQQQGGILVSGGFARLEPSVPGAFCRQKPKLCLTQILAPYVHLLLQTRTGKWLYISAKHAAHSAATAKPLLRKMKLKLNRW